MGADRERAGERGGLIEREGGEGERGREREGA